MARYRGARVKVVRRLGLLPGFTSKSTNKLGNNNSKQLSQYGLHLQEKQKLRYNYGISEHELIKYVKQARKRKGNTGDKLLQLLEMRLDTIVFRSGLAPTIVSARQLISHGHVFVNNQKVTIAGYNCNISDNISLNKTVNSLITDSKIDYSHLTLKDLNDKISISITNLPNLQILGYSVNILLVLEYYSGK